MYLKPLLSLQLTNKWLDPSLNEDDTIFRRKYTHAHARMTAYKDIIDLIENSGTRIEEIKRQLEVGEKNYGI